MPIAAVTSWRYAVHPDEPGQPAFSRDLLEVQILNASRSRRLVTVFNTHLKSRFVPFTEDPVAGAAAANARRRQQAQVTTAIVNERMRSDSRFLLVGDMNDPPDSADLQPMLAGIPLLNGLADAVEDRQAPADDLPAPAVPWTHRFKPTGRPAQYELFDHIWLSPALAGRLTGAGIGRRTRRTVDGSDNDPAWIDLDL